MSLKRPPVLDSPNNMAYLPLPNGERAIIDLACLPLVGERNWCSSSSGYVKTWAPGAGETLLHRMLLPGARLVDHINGNKLDNRLSNLRPATRSQNAANAKGQKDTTSQFKGVNWFHPTGRWTAKIVRDGTLYYLGYYDDERDAARAYDRAHITLYGDYSKLNFPDERPTPSPESLKPPPKQPHKSGHRGVFPTRDGKWMAQLSIKGKLVYLGRHPTPELASAAVQTFLASSPPP